MRPRTTARELAILDSSAAALPTRRAEELRRLPRELTDDWPCRSVVDRDLYEDQVMVGERIGLIDLDDAAIGPPELDTGNLLAHVELLGLRSGVELEPVVAQSESGYERSGASLDPLLLDRCRRLSLLRLVGSHDEPRLLQPAAA